MVVLPVPLLPIRKRLPWIFMVSSAKLWKLIRRNALKFKAFSQLWFPFIVFTYLKIFLFSFFFL